MRLTKDMRATFVNAVMADVPKVDYDSEIRDTAMDIALDALPRTVRQLYNKEDTRGYVRTHIVPLRIETPGGAYVNSISVLVPGNDTVVKLVCEGVKDLLAGWGAQHATRRQLSASLTTAVSNIQTTEELAKVYPEFARYVPKDPAAATRNLPALANVVSAFTQAGWPKNSKKKAEVA